MFSAWTVTSHEINFLSVFVWDWVSLTVMCAMLQKIIKGIFYWFSLAHVFHKLVCRYRPIKIHDDVSFWRDKQVSKWNANKSLHHKREMNTSATNEECHLHHTYICRWYE